MGSNLYIGAPNGVVICVDGMHEAGFYGTFYHRFSTAPVVFDSVMALLTEMEKLFDGMHFPRRGDNPRVFVKRGTAPAEYKEKRMTDEELLEKHGQQQTFIVRVQHRQNSTWQGQITWAEKNLKLNFRSIWEMVHMMENALCEDLPEEELPKVPAWEEKQE